MRIGAWRRPAEIETAHKVAKFSTVDDSVFQSACGEWFYIEGARMATPYDRCQRCELIEVVLL